MSDAPVVRFEVVEGIGVITVDYPPVNALGPGVSDGIVAAVDQGNADPAVQAMVLMGAGRTFIAGADIRRFGKPRPPSPRRSYDALDESAKPVVAAIHGYALGGGLENALSCQWRIAVPGAKVGLPEVLIGILPGGGGTQRLPRLIGAKPALEMIVTGRHVPAEEAKALGIVDAIIPGKDLRAEAIAFAKSVIGKPMRRISAMPPAAAEPGLFDDMRKSIARKARNQKAPYNCIAAVEAATRLPFPEGLAEEKRLFQELENAPEAQALRYAFFAEREIARIPFLPKDLALPEIRTAAVVGAGTMGGGIAMSFADNGFPVKLVDASPEGLARGLQRIRDNYAVSVKRGSITQAQMDERLPRIQPVERIEDIADCDVVIEAVFEQLPVKQEIFARLDAVMKPEAILLTNTSAIDIDRIADATKRPQMVAGAHFFAPANVMKLLEVVEGPRTAPEVLGATMKLGRAIGKISGYAGNCDGFVANRSRIFFTLEQNIMVEEGALPEQIDKVMVDFGYPMGPFAVNDMSGLDVSYFTRKRRLAEDPNYRTLPIPDRLVESGRKGQKTGAGWYRYEKGDRTPQVDPEVHRLIKEVAAEQGIEQRPFTDEEILHRLLFASVNEACKIIEEDKALRASDIDVMWLNGFGFPRYRGGLMFWADGIGAEAIYNQIAAWHQRYGDRWRPSALLRRIAESGGKLREAKAPRLQ
ncbi:3-hydroxyacyl-CoA dehydrogenase NAD-binding domain-containing protein [Siccirubricoccus sp. KC 17139]|uniref:3-hydroxyacyl-CoA dehydrogenase NAD-binding domain-containing protein n=1 Tax=Siccirubricoccus soli TaxID=2899147 RepID=A0ABT1DCT3_9PROT|nr:3-hydroxyacyl-CoA dehydrogenase NAD-binding domain-containing protein [Siccirubricoccus soli]MCO6419035.1 3-hydroxyacyl-CoA dehydrogenase NAD-binding domain-containing protein [Siccirubricoccus soli]MCP2685170.1 3-hydroxyacyl-CoA dehydrogenase NAD-binding domain-containing protein [Siccirubricoccus soli]